MAIKNINYVNWDSLRQTSLLVVTSGGYDPLHPGHVDSIKAMSTRALQAWDQKHLDAARGVYLPNSSIPKPTITSVVIVNGRNFLLKKKGFEFMPQSSHGHGSSLY